MLIMCSFLGPQRALSTFLPIVDQRQRALSTGHNVQHIPATKDKGVHYRQLSHLTLLFVDGTAGHTTVNNVLRLGQARALSTF